MAESRRASRSRIVAFVKNGCAAVADGLGDTTIEITGRKRMSVTGCRRILKYDSRNIILKLKSESLSVEGEGLVCISYLSGILCIEGYIQGINYINREEKI